MQQALLNKSTIVDLEAEMGSELIWPLAFQARHKTRQCQAKPLPFGLISHPTDTFLLLSMERMKIVKINAAMCLEELQQLDRKLRVKNVFLDSLAAIGSTKTSETRQK